MFFISHHCDICSMKSIVVLCIVFVMLVKPLWPIAEYIMNYDYIVNVLCENKDKPKLNCDRKCYLAKQLAKESKRNDKNPFGEKQSKTEIQHIVFFQSLPQVDIESQLLRARKDNFKGAQVLIFELFTTDILHPPELC